MCASAYLKELLADTYRGKLSLCCHTSASFGLRSQIEDTMIRLKPQSCSGFIWIKHCSTSGSSQNDYLELTTDLCYTSFFSCSDPVFIIYAFLGESLVKLLWCNHHCVKCLLGFCHKILKLVDRVNLIFVAHHRSFFVLIVKYCVYLFKCILLKICFGIPIFWHCFSFIKRFTGIQWNRFGREAEIMKRLSVQTLRDCSHLTTTTWAFCVVRNGLYGYQCYCSHLMTKRKMKQSSFSFIWFGKFVFFFEILVFSFNKYRYKLCTCVNMKIDTCAKISIHHY